MPDICFTCLPSRVGIYFVEEGSTIYGGMRVVHVQVWEVPCSNRLRHRLSPVCFRDYFIPWLGFPYIRILHGLSDLILGLLETAEIDAFGPFLRIGLPPAPTRKIKLVSTPKTLEQKCARTNFTQKCAPKSLPGQECMHNTWVCCWMCFAEHCLAALSSAFNLPGNTQ